MLTPEEFGKKIAGLIHRGDYTLAASEYGKVSGVNRQELVLAVVQKEAGPDLFPIFEHHIRRVKR